MIAIGIILSFISLVFLCWLLFALLCAQPHKSANNSQHRNARLMKLRMMPITMMVVASETQV